MQLALQHDLAGAHDNLHSRLFGELLIVPKEVDWGLASRAVLGTTAHGAQLFGNVFEAGWLGLMGS